VSIRRLINRDGDFRQLHDGVSKKGCTMNRRRAIAVLAGGVVVSESAIRAEQDKPPVPGAVKLELDKEVTIGVRSTPVKAFGIDLHLISIGKATFRLDKESRLSATLHVAVAQYSKVDFWISVAVFGASAKLLGTAGHQEAVRYERLGKMPTTFAKIELDFGISNAFKDAAFVVVAISERDVPKPG
jgi:hypothetical protein